MSTEANKAVVRQLFDAVNANDLEALLKLASENIVVHTPIPGIPPGHEGFRAFMGVYFASFPEQHVEVHELVAEGNRVLVRHTHHVTHGGDFAGLSPTGKQAVVDGVELFRVEHGRVTEMWRQDDLLGLMRQLGAIPGPGAPSP